MWKLGVYFLLFSLDSSNFTGKSSAFGWRATWHTLPTQRCGVDHLVLFFAVEGAMLRYWKFSVKMFWLANVARHSLEWGHLHFLFNPEQCRGPRRWLLEGHSTASPVVVSVPVPSFHHLLCISLGGLGAVEWALPEIGHLWYRWRNLCLDPVWGSLVCGAGQWPWSAGKNKTFITFSSLLPVVTVLYTE